MKRYWTLFLGLIGLLLATFLVAQSAGLDLENLWGELREWSPVAMAVLGIGLLVVDVLLPVPSILVIIGMGHVFGTVIGAALSMAGMVMACLLAFGIGRSGRNRIQRWVGPDEQARADALLARWGSTAIIISRPLPLLAEAVGVMAGASNMGWTAVTRAAAVGSAPVCFLYAGTGAGIEHLDHTGLVIGTVLGLAGLSWFLGRRVEEQINDAS